MILALSGCGGGMQLGRLLTRPVDTDLWSLPETSFRSQYLFKVRYQGIEGKASFRLTLYLVDRSRFRLAAADPFGRKLWTIDLIEEHSTVWLDHRQNAYCLAGPSDEILVPVARVRLRAVPKLMLGFVPTSVADDLERASNGLSFRDERGHEWNVGFSGTRLDWWSVKHAEEVSSWWKREDDGSATFFDKSGGHQLKWRHVVAEQLSGELESLEIPKRYQERSCSDL